MQAAVSDTIGAVLASGPLLCSLLTALQVTAVTAGGDVGLKTRVRGIDFAGEGCIGASAAPSAGRHPGNWYGCDETAADPSRQYNGRVFDSSTGFHDYGARLYWPEIGRFISVDAAGPSLGNPATFNRYSYVLNNPYKYVDPTGHFAMLPPNAMDGMPPGPFQWAMAQLVEAATYATQYYAKNSTDESSPGWQRTLNFVAGSAASLMTEVNADTTMMVLSVGSMKVSPRSASQPSLSAHKEVLKQVHDELGGSLPKGEPGKFGSPQRGTSKKGYRLDPAHPDKPATNPESKPHINWWDYTEGKKGSGGRHGAVPIGD